MPELPAPPTPLESPAKRYLVTFTAVTFTEDSYIFTATTDVATHLALIYSATAPLPYGRQCRRRGQTYWRDLAWSFTGHGFIDQDEAGDTLTHTWTVPVAELGGTLYYRYQAYYADQIACPSCSSTSLSTRRDWQRLNGQYFRIVYINCLACGWSGLFEFATHNWQPVSVSPYLVTDVPHPAWLEMIAEDWSDPVGFGWRFTEHWQPTAGEFDSKFLEEWSS